jgi:uncharacterized protein (DUF2267 family)
MDELVNAVAQRTGMSHEDAQKAVAAALDFLKTRLPAPIAGHLDAFLSGGSSGALGSLEGEAENLIKGKLDAMFGGNA